MHIDRVHTASCSSGHTFTQLPWCSRQMFTSYSHHIASRVEQICGTQCVAWRSALTVGIRYMSMHATPFLVVAQCAIARSRSIWIETTSGSGLGFNPVQYALGVQCGQAFSNIQYTSNPVCRLCAVFWSLSKDWQNLLVNECCVMIICSATANSENCFLASPHPCTKVMYWN